LNVELLQRIEQLYYEEKFSTRKVASSLSVPAQTVRDYLNTFSKGTRSASEACKLGATDEYRKKIGITKQGENNTGAKLTEKKVLLIRREYEELLEDGYRKTEAQHKLARKYNVKRPTISDVVLYKTWKHI
jgi:predicted DNA-binding protein YlxM (UPF0122 family)